MHESESFDSQSHKFIDRPIAAEPDVEQKARLKLFLVQLEGFAKTLTLHDVIPSEYYIYQEEISGLKILSEGINNKKALLEIVEGMQNLHPELQQSLLAIKGMLKLE